MRRVGVMPLRSQTFPRLYIVLTRIYGECYCRELLLADIVINDTIDFFLFYKILSLLLTLFRHDFPSS